MHLKDYISKENVNGLITQRINFVQLATPFSALGLSYGTYILLGKDDLN